MSQSFDDGTESALERVPTDVFVVLCLVLAVRVVVSLPLPGVVRSAFAGVFVLFLPGYAFTTAVFPGEEDWGLDAVERPALSFGLSLAGVPMLLIAIAPPGGLTPELVINVVTVPIVVFIALGAVRRFSLPSNERFEVDFNTLVSGSLGTLNESTNADALLSVVLVASVVLALGGLGYAVAAPPDHTASTSVSLLTQNGTEYTQGQYPTQPTVGESNPLTFRLENDEGRPVEYTVLVTLDRLTSNGTVIQQKRIDRFQPEVVAGGQWNRTHRVTPPSANKYRLTYLVYLDGVPDNPNRRSAYRSVYLWLDVDGTGSSDG